MGFKPPPKTTVPNVSEDRLGTFLGGAQTGGGQASPGGTSMAADEPKDKPSDSTRKSSSGRKKRSGSGASAAPGELIVVRDARYKSERQTVSFVLRFTENEKKAVDRAFEESNFKYLHQFIKATLFKGIPDDCFKQDTA